MERRARLRKIMATMDEEDERRAALPGNETLWLITRKTYILVEYRLFKVAHLYYVPKTVCEVRHYGQLWHRTDLCMDLCIRRLQLGVLHVPVWRHSSTFHQSPTAAPRKCAPGGARVNCQRWQAMRYILSAPLSRELLHMHRHGHLNQKQQAGVPVFLGLLYFVCSHVYSRGKDGFLQPDGSSNSCAAAACSLPPLVLCTLCRYIVSSQAWDKTPVKH